VSQQTIKSCENIRDQARDARVSAMVRRRKIGLGILLLLSMLVGSCTNSRLVLRPLYNSLDDQLQKQMLSYGEFDDAQKQAISGLLDHFHVWHRQSQLPHYAALSANVSESLRNRKTVSLETIQAWSRSFTQHASTLGRCSPVYLAGDVLATLDDQQVKELAQNRQEIRESRRKERNARLSELGLDSGGAAGADSTSPVPNGPDAMQNWPG